MVNRYNRKIVWEKDPKEYEYNVIYNYSHDYSNYKIDPIPPYKRLELQCQEKISKKEYNYLYKLFHVDALTWNGDLSYKFLHYHSIKLLDFALKDDIQKVNIKMLWEREMHIDRHGIDRYDYGYLRIPILPLSVKIDDSETIEPITFDLKMIKKRFKDG